MTNFPETLGLGQVISRELKEEIERRYNTYVELEQQLAAVIDKDLSGYILCDAAPVAWDYKGEELWYLATAEEKMVATPLYKAKEMK